MQKSDAHHANGHFPCKQAGLACCLLDFCSPKHNKRQSHLALGGISANMLLGWEGEVARSQQCIVG